MNRIILTAAAGILTLPLSAQTPAWNYDAGAALLWSAPALTKVTHNSTAFAVGVGVSFKLPNDLPTRVSLNRYAMSGKDYGTIRSSLTLTQVAWDLSLDTSLKTWSCFAGLSGNRYSVVNNGTETWVTDGHNPTAKAPQYVWAVTNDASRSWKLGIRVGVEHRWTPHLVSDLTFQATELSGGERRGAPNTNYPNDGGVNPTWIQVGLRYAF